MKDKDEKLVEDSTVEKTRTPWYLSIPLVIVLALFGTFLLPSAIAALVLGILRMIKTNKKKSAIALIVVGALSCMICFAPDGEYNDNTEQLSEKTNDIGVEKSDDKKEEATAEPTPTVNPEEEISLALSDNDEETLLKYSDKKVYPVVEKMIQDMDMASDEDIASVKQLAKLYLNAYPKGKNAAWFKQLKTVCKEYESLLKQINAPRYDDIESEFEDMGMMNEMSYLEVYVNNDIQSSLSKFLNLFDDTEYKHAYYANAVDHSLFGDYPDDTYEYVIYTNDAFPKAGVYELMMAPTGGTVTVSSSGGFENEVQTYIIPSESELEEWEEICVYYDTYLELRKALKRDKKELKRLCKSSSAKAGQSEKATGNANTSSGNAAEYILPNSDSEYLKKKDIKEISKEDLRYARNEIYARHGYIFQSEDLSDYFMTQSWYTPMIEASDFNESELNKYEKANIKFIEQYE